MPLSRSSKGATSCSKPVTAGEVRDHSAELAKEMGLGQKCQKAASDQYSNSIHTFNAEAHASALWGAASVGASATKNDFATASNHAMAESGCGTFNLSATKILEAHNAMSCELHNSSQQTSASAAANATINIVAKRTVAKQQELDKMYAIVVQDHPTPQPYMPGAGAMPMNRLIAKDNQALIASHRADVQGARMNARPPYINMSNVKLSNTASTKMNVINSLSTTQKSAIKDQMKAIAKATAENDVQKKTGVMSLSANTKNVISRNIDRQSSSMDEHINNMTESTKVKVNANGSVTIEAENVDMKNVVVDQNIQATLMLQKAAGTSIQLGKQASSDLVNELNSKTVDQHEASGLKELAEARGKAQADALKGLADVTSAQYAGMAQFAAATSGGGAMMYIIIAVVVLGVLGKLTGMGGGMPMTPMGIVMKLVMYLVIAMVIYFVVAYIFGLWPFNSSKEKMVVPSNSNAAYGKPWYSGNVLGGGERGFDIESSDSSLYLGNKSAKKEPKY